MLKTLVQQVPSFLTIRHLQLLLMHAPWHSLYFTCSVYELELNEFDIGDCPLSNNMLLPFIMSEKGIENGKLALLDEF